MTVLYRNLVDWFIHPIRSVFQSSSSVCSTLDTDNHCTCCSGSDVIRTSKQSKLRDRQSTLNRRIWIMQLNSKNKWEVQNTSWLLVCESKCLNLGLGLTSLGRSSAGAHIQIGPKRCATVMRTAHSSDWARACQQARRAAVQLRHTKRQNSRTNCVPFCTTHYQSAFVRCCGRCCLYNAVRLCT